MCVGAKGLCAAACGDVLEVDDACPGAGHAERVAVAFDEAVDEVDLRSGVFGPCYRVVVECLKRACGVVFDEFFDNVALSVVFGVRFRFFEIFHDFLYSCGVEPADSVDLFGHFPVFVFDEAAVESVGNRGEVGAVFQCSVVGFHFVLCQAGSVEVACRCGHEVGVVGLVDALGEVGRVEHHFHEFGLLVGSHAGAVELLGEELF